MTTSPQKMDGWKMKDPFGMGIDGLFSRAMSAMSVSWREYKSYTLRIQVSPKEGISPIILFWGWDGNPQSYSREVSGFLGLYIYIHRTVKVALTRNLHLPKW